VCIRPENPVGLVRSHTPLRYIRIYVSACVLITSPRVDIILCAQSKAGDDDDRGDMVTVYDMWCGYDMVRRSCATENRGDRSE